MASAMQPTLWHITISHYSEKARWALDYKSIPYRLRGLVPGAHIPVALWLTYGRHYTLPVLDLGGERIGDSTAIIAALEQRQPEPPLYPRDPAQRRRALALEEWFEAELGGRDYLVGESFSVADLTAAALLYPLVRPPEAYVTIDRMPEPVERLRAQLRERRGYRWVEETFRRHRRSAEAPSGAADAVPAPSEVGR